MGGAHKSSTPEPAEIEKVIGSFDYKRATKFKIATKKPELFADYFSEAYSEGILQQLLSIFDYIRGLQAKESVQDILMLGAIGLLEEVSNIRKHGSHYRFLNKTESVGMRKTQHSRYTIKDNVGSILQQRHAQMLEDIKGSPSISPKVRTDIRTGDARNMAIPDKSVTAIITSPPYLNRNNYIAQQKAELSILGLVKDYPAYKELVRSTFRSHVESALDKVAASELPEVSLIL